MNKPVVIPELYVLSMPNPHNDSLATVKPWKGMESLFLVEDCARYSFALTKDDFEKLPPVIAETIAKQSKETESREYPVTIISGIKAYENLLRLAVGLEDADRRTAAVKRYVLPQWQAFKTEHPERSQEFEHLMRNISADYNIIHSHTAIAQIAKPTLETSAKRIMGLSKPPNAKQTRQTQKQAILVVADKAPITQGVIENFAHSSAVATICLTHPDPAELEARWNEIQSLIADKRFPLQSTNLVKMPFEQALNTDPFNHVVICTPIGKYPKEDEYLIAAWQSRKREDGYLVHRKGNPAARQTTTPPYSSANLKNFVGVEQLDAEGLKMLSENERELQQAEAMTRSRAANRFINDMTASGISPHDDPAYTNGRGK